VKSCWHTYLFKSYAVSPQNFQCIIRCGMSLKRVRPGGLSGPVSTFPGDAGLRHGLYSSPPQFDCQADTPSLCCNSGLIAYVLKRTNPLWRIVCFLPRTDPVVCCCVLYNFGNSSHEKLVAQINSATITGSIFDSSRAAIPGANVTVINEDTKCRKCRKR